MDALGIYDPAKGFVRCLGGLSGSDLHCRAIEAAGQAGCLSDYLGLHERHLRRLAEHHPASYTHSIRVGLFAVEIAAMERRHGLAADVPGALLAGAAHDVGKCDVPIEVLQHPGKLGPGEWAAIRRHPQAGYEALRADTPGPAIVAAIHHSFQPNGYGSDETVTGPIGAAVLALAKVVWLADFVDAMTSRRDASSRIDNPSDMSAARAVATEVFRGQAHRIYYLLGEPDLPEAVGQ